MKRPETAVDKVVSLFVFYEQSEARYAYLDRFVYSTKVHTSSIIERQIRWKSTYVKL